MITDLCPVCAQPTLLPARVGTTSVWRCNACTATITPTDRAEHADSDHYKHQYMLVKPNPYQAEHHRYFRFPENAHLLAEVSKHAPAPARWLDIGCDHGFFLDDARRRGYTVQGVEPADRAREYALNIGLNVVPDIAEVQGSFGVISMWHVLEHISTPREYIQQLINMLDPGGVLAIRVPDFDSFSRKVLRDKWIWFIPYLHCVHYNLRSLTIMLEQLGMAVILAKRQRPNNLRTRRAYRLANSVYNENLTQDRIGLLAKIKRLGADLTSQELFVIARKK